MKLKLSEDLVGILEDINKLICSVETEWEVTEEVYDKNPSTKWNVFKTQLENIKLEVRPSELSFTIVKRDGDMEQPITRKIRDGKTKSQLHKVLNERLDRYEDISFYGEMRGIIQEHVDVINNPPMEDVEQSDKRKIINDEQQNNRKDI